MASTLHLRKFDPTEHVGNVYDAFVDFLGSFAYEYEVLAKPPPAGTLDAAAWTQQDKRKYLLGRFASRNLQLDFEAETTEDERATISYDATIQKLKDRYKPTQNTTLANYQFHRLRQGDLEPYDTFVNRVRQEASNCEFKCNNACTIRDTLIRDQIIIGTSDNEIRKKALSEQWGLTDLVAKGRQMEAATAGAQKIKQEVKDESSIGRLKPGKYSRKNTKGTASKQCPNCSNKTCKGGDKCAGRDIECFDCHTIGHFKGAANCKKKKKPGKSTKKEKTRRVERKRESDSDSSSDSSSEDAADVSRITTEKGIQAANIVAHVRRSATRIPKGKRKLRYEVPILIKEQVVNMFADTGADISVMSKTLAKELNLPLVHTKMRIKPYGMKKRIKCVGYYVGPLMYEDIVAHVGIYVVNNPNVEPLLSGSASEALGIITFNGGSGAAVRRCTEDKETEDPVKQVYISKFPPVFDGVGEFPNYTCKYYVDKSVPPVACPPRTVPYHLEAQYDKEIEKLETAGIVEVHEGPAPWISNIRLAPRPDGGVRPTLDMREPNKAIQGTGLPIPRAEDIRRGLAGCSLFTKLDFKTAFHQIVLDEESRYLTVFPHKGRLKRFTRLTMGAKPASGELNKALQPVFAEIPNVHIIHDDVVIATASEEEHDKIVETVLQTLEDLGLTLNPNKCIFKKPEIPFWGMLISKDGVRPDPTKVQALRDATHPETKAELMSFLCMVQASGEFIPGLSRETANLRELTRKNARFKWSKKCQKEFNRLKELLCEDAMLAYYETSSSTYLLVDAHKTGISAILAQGSSPETARMVTCASRATTAVERHYPQLDLEALAIDFALRRFRHYIVGDPKEVTVVTDHKPLISIFRNTRRGSIRTDRIKLRHQDINYKVVYQKGGSNRADFMSRRGTKLEKVPQEWKEEAQELEKTVWFLNLSPYSEAVSLPNIIQETQKDQTLAKLVSHIRQGYIPKGDKVELKEFANVWDSLTVSDSGLVLKGEKIVLPKTLWQLAVDKAHQGGHPGITRMKNRIRNHFWIPGLNQLVEKKIHGCRTCQLYTPKTTKEPIAPQRTNKTSWEEVSVDLFGPLPDKRHVLVVQDTMSRFPAAAIVQTTAAQPVLKALDKIYTSYGHPERHRTDNGPPFNSQDFTQYSAAKGIEHVASYPHHPQANPCETFMKPLGKALKAAYYNRDSAQKALDELLMAYRATPHPATKATPGDLMFRHGYRADFPKVTENPEEVQAARAQDKKQKQDRKERINASSKRAPMKVNVGDKVLLKAYPKGKKFQPVFEEEVHEVVQIEEKGVIVRNSNGRQKRRHKDDIKLYYDIEDPSESENENTSEDEREATEDAVEEVVEEVVEEAVQEVVEEIIEAGEREIDDRMPQNDQPHPDVNPVRGDDGDQTLGNRYHPYFPIPPIPGNVAIHIAGRPQRNRKAPSRLKDYVVNRLRRVLGRG